MKTFIIAVFSFITCQALGQNFVLPDGEYMDTVSNQNESCKNYNAYFYQVDGKYPESSTSLLKKLQTFLQQKNEAYSGSGYITFRFTVDCEAKLMQKVQLMQTD
jgi:hypothetical protein